MPRRVQKSGKARSLTADFWEVPALSTLLAPVARWPPLLALVAANAFDELEVSVALWATGESWYPISLIKGDGVVAFEQARGVANRRWAYNDRCQREAMRTRRLVHGQHAGLHDLFVPLLAAGQVHGVFVTGPFATERPSSAGLSRRFRDLTGTRARLTDPAFSDFVSRTLAVLTLEGPLCAAFERLMECFSALVAGAENGDALAAEAHELRKKLARARHADQMWDAARELSDEHGASGFATHAHGTMAALGLAQVPEHAVAGLVVGRSEGEEPIDALLRRHEFQRQCVELATRLGSTVSGRIGDHGAFFLVDHRGTRARSKNHLLELARLAAGQAQRLGLRLHAGVTLRGEEPSLPATCRRALYAAERALSQGVGVALSSEVTAPPTANLSELRAELVHSVAERGLLSARFARYTEAALTHHGYRLAAVRFELAFGIERLAAPLLDRGALDKKSYRELSGAAEVSAENARTTSELVAAYRSLVLEIEGALKRPEAARKDRSTRRALSFVQEHMAEPFTVAEVARVAGYAPDYFSKLFKRDQGMTFAHYVKTRRIERAKELLWRTRLSVEEVQRLCGFRTRTYFHRAFREVTGKTPAAQRGY